MPNTPKQDDFFKIDPEMHLVGDKAALSYFPGVKMWWKAAENAVRALYTMPPGALPDLDPRELEKHGGPDFILWMMDRYGIDIACLLPESMADTTGYTEPWYTNTAMAKVVESNPHRFLYNPNLGSIKHKGIKNTLWELEYWVKEKGAKIFKYYSPEDTFINDPELWPVYEKAQELNAVLCFHTGVSWVPPGVSKYCHPALLDDVARDFPELKIVAFHMGYPNCDELNMVAMGHPNVYPCLTLMVPFALNAPRKFARILGEALRWVGPDRIIWGTDYSAGSGTMIASAVVGLRDFQMPKDLQADYGYPEITDEIRRKIFGENLARLLGIDPTVRRAPRSAQVATADR